MIENKLITIRKSTTFDKGWALVKPYQATFTKNRYFSELNVTDTVRAITKSTQVNLILSEPCLSSQIVKELEWVNKYITINLIAKTQKVADGYSQLKFNNVEIDKDIDFNYIAVKGKSDLYAIIAEDYVAADESVNKVYFEKAKVNTQYAFLMQAKSVIFIDKYNNKDYTKLFNACLEFNIPTAYLVGTTAYSQELVNKFKGLNTKLLCSDSVRNGILYSTEDGRIYCVHLTSKGVLVSVEIESANYYIGQPFECLKLADVIGVKKIPQGCYVCDSGKVTPLNIAKQKVIERTIQIDEMKDFVEENFDRSETDNYNQYCTEAEEVVYNFTLIPPLFNTEKISDIYEGVESVFAKWRNNFKTIDLTEIINTLSDLGLNEGGLCLLCKEIISFDKSIARMVSKHKYKNYYEEIKTFKDLITYSTIDDYCKELFTKINAENADTKFDKFDKEIERYRQIIEEKQALIAKGINVSENEDLIKPREEKIDELTTMKQRFSGSANVRDGKQLDAFMTLCGQVLDGKYVEIKREVDSIGNVLASKETAKIVKLETFVKTYLYDYNAFIESAKEIVNELGEVDFPTAYIVYEQDGKDVIYIENEQEYYDTENIRKRYDLHCVTRREL